MKYIVDGVLCDSVTIAINTILDADREDIHGIVSGLYKDEEDEIFGARVKAVADDE